MAFNLALHAVNGGGAVFYPKCAAVLTVPTFGAVSSDDAANHGGDSIDIPIRVRSATLTLNSHLQADELHLTTTWLDAGIDPRLIKNATVQFWLGNVPFGQDIKADTHFRFVGIAHEIRRQSKGHEGTEVELSFQDYTTMFLNAKPFPSDGIPNYTDNLTTAWQKICDYTGFYDKTTNKIVSSVAALRDRLALQGDIQDIPLGNSVPARIKSLGKIPVKPEQSAWDVWQVCCGMLGLISYIDRDRCIVTTSTDHFSISGTTPPKFVWGDNILEVDEKVQSVFSSKGVGLTSYNPLTGTVIEAFYPPAGDARIHVKRSVAKRKDYKPSDLQSDQYDMFEYNGLTTTDQGVLQTIAERAYEERARQEILGKLTTAEMELTRNTAAGGQSTYDLLSLRAGDAIQVCIDQNIKDQLLSIPTTAGQLKYLTDQVGYTEQLANLIIKGIVGYNNLRSVFHVKQAMFKLDEHSWNVEIEYQNLIDVRGNSTAKGGNSTQADKGHVPPPNPKATVGGSKVASETTQNGNTLTSISGRNQPETGGQLVNAPIGNGAYAESGDPTSSFGGVADPLGGKP